MVANNRNNGDLKELLLRLDRLSTEEKIELIQHLQESVESTHAQPRTGSIIGPVNIQISLTDRDSFADVLRSMADVLGGSPTKQSTEQ